MSSLIFNVFTKELPSLLPNNFRHRQRTRHLHNHKYITQVWCRTCKTSPHKVVYIFLIIFLQSPCKTCFFECFIKNIVISFYILKTCSFSHNVEQDSQIESFFNESWGITYSQNAGSSLYIIKLFFSFLFQVNNIGISASVSVRAFALILFNSNHPSNIVFSISFWLVTSSYVS